MATTPVSLPGKSHGQSSLVGHSPWGCEGAEHDLVTEHHGSAGRHGVYSFHAVPPSPPSWQAGARPVGRGSHHTPEHMWPAVGVVAAHLQADTEDGVHAQDVGCVQPHPRQLPDLLQFLLHF